MLAAVNHAIYLLTEAGDLVWLASADSPMHRRCVRWPDPLPEVTVDTLFRVQDRSIDLASGIKLELSPSKVWEAPSVPVQEVIDLDILPYKLSAVFETFSFQESPLDVGLFIRSVLQIARNEQLDTDFMPEDALSRRVWTAVERIARACLHRDLSELLKETEPLIGLGEGLTPTGDDFLGGLFFAIFILSCSDPTIHYYGPANLPEWVDKHRSRTNQISFALLKDNASGHALEPLNRFGIALLTDGLVENVTSAVVDLVKVGHSTGCNLLAGFVTGMLLVYPKSG